MPSGILGLQRDQPGHGVVPTLRSGPLVRGATITDLGERLLDLTTGAISSLSFGVAEGVLADGLATLYGDFGVKWDSPCASLISLGVNRARSHAVARLR